MQHVSPAIDVTATVDKNYSRKSYTSASLPKSKKMSNALTRGTIGTLVTFLVKSGLRVAPTVFSAVMGAVIDHEVEPD